MRGRNTAGGFVFVGMGSFQETHWGHRTQYPGELRHQWYVGVAKKTGSVRVSPASQEVERYSPDVFAECSWILERGESVIIGNEIESFTPILQLYRWFERSKVVPDVQSSRGLNAS